MGTARLAKVYLSLCVCIQLLKIIKFTNVLIPKMSLMTAVLGKGFADLAFFGIVFLISMLAFCMMFYVQLGSVMEDFNDQIASFISLARALFGDFDIDDIMNNSSGYLNAVLFLVYLFVAGACVARTASPCAVPYAPPTLTYAPPLDLTRTSTNAGACAATSTDTLT